jgi:CBS domain-containing protein
MGDGLRARIPVVEIMSTGPSTISADATVADVASVMKAKEIGSLIVLEDGRPNGIVTERDIVTKVAAFDKKPSTVLVKEIMTSPLIAIHPHQEVVEAAKIMSGRKIRRLPVIKDGQLVGIVTENDILRVWPSLIEVTREWDRVALEAEFAHGVEGHCEACGLYSSQLMWDRNLLLCPECRSG